MYIYILTNAINGKQYVGQSAYDPVHGRIKVHFNGYRDKLFTNDLKKYGKESFTYEVVDCGDISQKSLNRLEIRMIRILGTRHPDGYNLSAGGGRQESLTNQEITEMRKLEEERQLEHEKELGQRSEELRFDLKVSD